MLAKFVNDNACLLGKRGVLEFFASNHPLRASGGLEFARDVYQIRLYRAGKGKRPDPLKDLPIPPDLRRDS